jgi:hypothetical protein
VISRASQPSAKTAGIVHHPTVDELARLGDELARYMVSQIESMEKARRKKRLRVTSAQRADFMQQIVEWKRIVALVRRDPAKLIALDLRIVISLENFKTIDRLPPVERRAVTVRLIANEIHHHLGRKDPRLRALIAEDPSAAAYAAPTVQKCPP